MTKLFVPDSSPFYFRKVSFSYNVTEQNLINLAKLAQRKKPTSRKN